MMDGPRSSHTRPRLTSVGGGDQVYPRGRGGQGMMNREKGVMVKYCRTEGDQSNILPTCPVVATLCALRALLLAYTP